MISVALFLTISLAAVAAIHLLWAVGYWIPIADEASLARAVVGARGQHRMPGPVPCTLVGIVLMTASAVPFWPVGGPRTVALFMLASVFLLRGVAAYLPAWRRITPTQPFATYDRRYYGPLCLLLGTAALAIGLT